MRGKIARELRRTYTEKDTYYTNGSKRKTYRRIKKLWSRTSKEGK